MSQSYTRATHTLARLVLSRAAYDEIRKKLAEAGYDKNFFREADGQVSPTGNIDMTGLAIELERSEPETDVRLGIAALGVDVGYQHLGDGLYSRVPVKCMIPDCTKAAVYPPGLSIPSLAYPMCADHAPSRVTCSAKECNDLAFGSAYGFEGGNKRHPKSSGMKYPLCKWHLQCALGDGAVRADDGPAVEPVPSIGRAE